MIWIPGNTASSKNSRINTGNYSFMSKTAKKYLRSFGIQNFSSSKKTVKGYKTIPMTFPVKELKEMFKDVEYPVEVGFRFVRGTRHKADFGNLTQILFDLFTAFDIIPDDNMDYVVARVKKKKDGTFYDYDKEFPGCWVSIIK